MNFLGLRSNSVKTKLKKVNPFQNMNEPLAHLPDCNYYHYCLQLNAYRYILETEYGFKVSEMLLGVFHPLPGESAPLTVYLALKELKHEKEN